MRRISTLFGVLVFFVGAWGQVSITSLGTPFTDNFTGFSGGGDPSNWVTTDETNTSDWRGNNQGGSATGGKYSFGTLPDGSLGFLPSNSRAIFAEISFVNNTGQIIQSIDIAYVAEQWRCALSGRFNGWSVEYKIGSGSYISIPSLAYVARNDIGSSSSGEAITPILNPRSAAVTGLTISDGQTFSIRFFGDNGTGLGSRQGVAIDDFLLAANTVLPINLLTFTAKAQKENVLLQWQTATEINNDYMAVERSQDGRNYQEIGRVQGMGTTQESQSYHFEDENPWQGINFYRLRQVDFDGQMEYHKVVAVNFGGHLEEGHLQLYPTIVQDIMTVTYDRELTAEATIQIIGLDGRVWQQQSTQDFQNGAWNVASLPAGMYLLQLRDRSNLVFERFVKQ